MQCPAAHGELVQAALIVASAALAVVVAWFVTRLADRHETNRRRRLMAESLERYEQAQNRWVQSPHVDLERRKD